MSDVIGTVIVSICGAIMAVVGIALLVPALRARALVKRASSWPSTTGTVLESRVEESVLRGSVGNTRRVQHSYRPAVQVRFEAGGRTFTSSRIYFGATLATPKRGEAEVEADKYPAGAQVPIYFDPLDPSTAVLERRTSQVPFVAGLLLVALGAGTAAIAILVVAT